MTKLIPANGARSQVERIEHALAIAAYIVLKHGQDYAPIFERLERELEAARNGPEERARRVLQGYMDAGARKAILLNQP